jgi:hypothetical protein
MCDICAFFRKSWRTRERKGKRTVVYGAYIRAASAPAHSLWLSMSVPSTLFCRWWYFWRVQLLCIYICCFGVDKDMWWQKDNFDFETEQQRNTWTLPACFGRYSDSASISKSPSLYIDVKFLVDRDIARCHSSFGGRTEQPRTMCRYSICLGDTTTRLTLFEESGFVYIYIRFFSAQSYLKFVEWIW